MLHKLPICNVCLSSEMNMFLLIMYALLSLDNCTIFTFVHFDRKIALVIRKEEEEEEEISLRIYNCPWFYMQLIDFFIPPIRILHFTYALLYLLYLHCIFYFFFPPLFYCHHNAFRSSFFSRLNI